MDEFPYVIYVINISDERWKKYENDSRFTRWFGCNGKEDLTLDFVNDKYHFYWNCNNDLRMNIAGCSQSHLSSLKYIYENKINNVIIIEDDTLYDFEKLKDSELLKRNQVCYIGGDFHPCKLKDKNQFIKPKYIVEKLSYKKIDTKSFLISGAFGYYIPSWELALTMMKQKGKKRRAIDVEYKNLQKEGFIQDFIYPPLVKLNMEVAMTGFTYNDKRYKLKDDLSLY